MQNYEKNVSFPAAGTIICASKSYINVVIINSENKQPIIGPVLLMRVRGVCWGSEYYRRGVADGSKTLDGTTR